MSGYSRDTTPQLRQLDVINFPQGQLLRYRDRHLGALHVLADVTRGVQEQPT